MRKIIFSLFTIFLCLCFSPITIEAADYRNYNLSIIPESECGNDTSIISGSVIYFQDADGTIKKGNMKNVFRYLKDSNADKINPYIGKEWGKVSSGADGYDMIVFEENVTLSKNGAMFVVRKMASQILIFQQAIITQIIAFQKPFEPIICMLVWLYWFIGLSEAIKLNQMSIEDLARRFILLIFTLFIMKHFDVLFTVWLSLSNTLVTLFSQYADATLSSNSLIYQYDFLVDCAMKADQNNFFSSWGGMSTSLLNLILGQGMSTVVYLTVPVMFYSRKLIFCLRAFLFPVGFSSFAKDGFQSNGVKYVKSMIGEAVTMGLYMLILCLGIQLQSTINASSNGMAVYNIFIVPLTVILLIASCKALGNEVGHMIYMKKGR